MKGREGKKRTGRKGQEERGNEGLRRVGPLITVGGVVVICSSIRWWSWLFVHHCMLIAVDGVVVVVWAFVALVVWACPSVNGMVVGAAFWFAILDHVVGGCWWSWVMLLSAFVAVCGYWELATVVVCRARVVFPVLYSAPPIPVGLRSFRRNPVESGGMGPESSGFHWNKTIIQNKYWRR